MQVLAPLSASKHGIDAGALSAPAYRKLTVD
jgi:hypothetical protein